MKSQLRLEGNRPSSRKEDSTRVYRSVYLYRKPTVLLFLRGLLRVLLQCFDVGLYPFNGGLQGLGGEGCQHAAAHWIIGEGNSRRYPRSAARSRHGTRQRRSSTWQRQRQSSRGGSRRYCERGISMKFPGRYPSTRQGATSLSCTQPVSNIATAISLPQPMLLPASTAPLIFSRCCGPLPPSILLRKLNHA